MTKFSVSFGGHKDGVGTIELGKPKGFDADCVTAEVERTAVGDPDCLPSTDGSAAS
jgi:hypothetical protein